MNEGISFLKDKIANLTEKPGCYLYYNANNQVIYVGKAKNIKKRVYSYLAKSQNHKTTLMLNEVCKIETIITQTEKEALILEHNLIKRYKPRYNVLLNDDKHYPYIVITKEKDPQYLYVRRLNKKYAKTYGPFPEGSHARHLLKILERLYPLRKCKGNIGKPCLYYHIKQCSGACFKNVPNSYYDQQIKKVDNLFKGKTTEVKEKLEALMNFAASNLQFEEAQKIKELLFRLDWTIGNQDVELQSSIKNLDVIGIYQQDLFVVITILFYRIGKLSYKESESFSTEEYDLEEIVRLFLQSVYDYNPVPKKIIIDKKITNIDEIKLLFNNVVRYPNYKWEKKLVELAQENGKQYFDQQFAYLFRKEKRLEILKELQLLLKMKNYPAHIEMYDIANIQTEFVTGGAIVYKNGFPSKHDYRKYNIEIEQQDDYHRTKELVIRRFKDFAMKNRAIPDLIIVDGGVQQLNACLEVLEKYDLDIKVVGLVKNNRHQTEYLLDTDKTKILLDKHSDLFNFLSNLQTDVHNFTISSFRKRQRKALTTSILEQVPQLGTKRIAKLYEVYNSIDEIKQATFEDLQNILKNKKLVGNLQDFLLKFNK